MRFAPSEAKAVPLPPGEVGPKGRVRVSPTLTLPGLLPAVPLTSTLGSEYSNAQPSIVMSKGGVCLHNNIGLNL